MPDHFFPPRHGGPVFCSICRQPIQTPMASDDGVCDQMTCQTRKKMQEAAAKAKAVQDADKRAHKYAKARTRSPIKQAASEIGHPDLRTIATGYAPYINLPIVPLPKARQEEFETHLRTIIEASLDAAEEASDIPHPSDDPGYERRHHTEQPEPFVYNAACIACQGNCCTLGGQSHAFLTEKTINYVRWSHPEKSPDEIFEMFQSYYPDTSTSGSCVYHGREGCTLPRHLRADICNTFQCRARRALMANHKRKSRNGAVVAGLSEDHTKDPSAGAPLLRVVSVSAANEVRIHTGIELPALKEPKKTP